MKRLNPAIEKSLQKVLARQSPLQQWPNDLQQGFQPVEVSPSHTVLLVGMGDGTATHKHGERCVSIVHQ
jgi:hypothetical protein